MELLAIQYCVEQRNRISTLEIICCSFRRLPKELKYYTTNMKISNNKIFPNHGTGTWKWDALTSYTYTHIIFIKPEIDSHF